MTSPQTTPTHDGDRRAARAALRQCLYLSQLADGHRYDALAAIAQVSRVRNAADGIAGVLLFDGHRFCQVFEGPAARVGALMDSIARDPRHRDMAVLLDRTVDAPSGLRGWASGYCDADDLDGLDGDTALRGAAAWAALKTIIARSDLVG